MNRPVENGMVIGLAAALDRQYPDPVSDAALEIAQERVICDIDMLANGIGMVGSSDLRDSADRMLRMPHRANEADLDLLLAGALLSAKRGDAEGCFQTLRKFTERYLAQQADEVARIAGGA